MFIALFSRQSNSFNVLEFDNFLNMKFKISPIIKKLGRELIQAPLPNPLSILNDLVIHLFR